MATFLPEIKRREGVSGTTLLYRSRPNGFATWSDGSLQARWSEEIMSQCHKGRWPVPYDSESDVGGRMTLTRRAQTFESRSSLQTNLFQGPIALSGVLGYTLGQSPAVITGDATLNAFGTSAIAKVLPTNPNASLATTIGEIRREGLPRLPGSQLRDQTSAARRAGGEYLNVEFGWLPLVNDLQAFATSVKRSRALIEQYRRDSDRKIRRRFVESPVLSTSIHGPFNGLTNGSFFVPGTSVSRWEEERYWFSGAFRYHVPVGDDFMSRLARYEQYSNYLFGSRITPELVWNLAPWSWAVDWFTNAGDVVHNISQLGSDGLVMQYGYAMRHKRVTETASGAFQGGTITAPLMSQLSTTWTTETKQRIPANPYGFGIDDLSLTERQLAILAALGLTKGKRNRY